MGPVLLDIYRSCVLYFYFKSFLRYELDFPVNVVYISHSFTSVTPVSDIGNTKKYIIRIYTRLLTFLHMHVFHYKLRRSNLKITVAVYIFAIAYPFLLVLSVYIPEAYLPCLSYNKCSKFLFLEFVQLPELCTK